MKSEPAEEQNPDAESAAQETKEKAAEEVKEEPKDQEDEKEQQPEAAADAEVEEKDRSLTDPSLKEQKPAAMAAPPPVAEDDGIDLMEAMEEDINVDEETSAPSPDPMAGIGYWESPGNSPGPARRRSVPKPSDICP